MHVCVIYRAFSGLAHHLTSYTRVGAFEWSVTCQLAQAATLYTLLHSSHGSTVPGLLAPPVYVVAVQIWDVWVSLRAECEEKMTFLEKVKILRET